MKHIISLMICVIIIFSLCACSAQELEFKDPIDLFYLLIQPADHIHHGSADSIIAPEQREGYKIRNMIPTVLETYLKGPVTESYQTPFPHGTSLINVAEESGNITITLSDEIADITGIELILACACLSRTCMELWDFDTVNILAETRSLDGKPMITFDKTNFLLTDDTVSYLETENG